MNNKITFGILVVVAVIFSVGIWWYFSSLPVINNSVISKQSQSQNSQVQPSTQPQPKITTTQIAGWQTYTNAQYGFSVEYPATYKNVGSGSEPVQIYSTDNQIELNVIVDALNSFDGNCNYYFPNGNTQQVTLNGNQFVKGDASGLFSGNQTRNYADEYCITRNGLTYRINTISYYSYLLQNPPPRSTLESDATVNTMLSTFTFTK